MHLIKTYGHEGMHNTSHWFVYKMIEILRIIIMLGTTAQSEAAKVAKERLVRVDHLNCLLART